MDAFHRSEGFRVFARLDGDDVSARKHRPVQSTHGRVRDDRTPARRQKTFCVLQGSAENDPAIPGLGLEIHLNQFSPSMNLRSARSFPVKSENCDGMSD